MMMSEEDGGDLVTTRSEQISCLAIVESGLKKLVMYYRDRR
jgi:hypothetical protein